MQESKYRAQLMEHKKFFFGSSLASFHRVAVDMAACKDLAVGDTCTYIGKCTQPVCADETMYNDTKIESLCGMCLLAGQQTVAGATPMKGCFAMDASVHVEGAGPVPLARVTAGDRIEAAALDGTLEYSRVIFTHEHVDSMETVRLSVGSRMMELTMAHQVPVYTEECGRSFCGAAKLVKAMHLIRGDRLYVSDGKNSFVETVSASNRGHTEVKYIVTEAGNLVVNGVVASVFSTMAKHLETLPFYVLDSLIPGIFEWAPVKAAMFGVLESPVLEAAETVVDMIVEGAAGQWGPVKAVTAGSATHVLSRGFALGSE
mmetsp:Transcript_14499/g.21152  ORF Transcript_14499/g.21152 Transcript_14499/m.21152 type:complete len:316 (-) Transcript_14499:105-1052(-)